MGFQYSECCGKVVGEHKKSTTHTFKPTKHLGTGSFYCSGCHNPVTKSGHTKDSKEE